MEKIRICYNVENKNRSKIYILNLSQKKYISSKDMYIYNPSCRSVQVETYLNWWGEIDL